MRNGVRKRDWRVLIDYFCGYCSGKWLFCCLLLTILSQPAYAHSGPPFPIIVDQAVGPYIVSVWANPNVGTGKFYVMLDPPPGGTLPQDTTVQVAVQPLTHRLPEASYVAHRDSVPRVQYLVEIPFDAQERWHVRILLQSSRGGGETASDVDVTPPGLGPWDLLLYLFPFLAIGLLWLRGMQRNRARAVPRIDN